MHATVGVGWAAGSFTQGGQERTLRAEPEGSAKWGMGHLGCGNSKCKSPVAVMCMALSTTAKKATVAMSKVG